MRRLLAAAALLLLVGVAPAAAQTYTLAPLGYQTMLDANGDPIADGCVWTYTAGTSTPVTTYRTSSGTANTNPVEADSAGRYVIFLAPGLTYKFVYESGCDPPTHGAVLRTVDNLSAVALGSVQANDIGPCEGRMTLTSGTPITSADVTAATSIYWTPYKGNVCPIYDPTAGSWSLLSFSELTLTLGTDSASLPYDLFAYSNAGTMALERLAWTSDTVRATALTKQDGVYVKSGQTSRRYLGTYRTTTVIGQTEDSLAKRFVWNYYNRVERPMRVLETTDSYVYSTNVLRQTRAQTTNQLAIVVGLAEGPITVNALSMWASDNVADNASIAIGEDSTTAMVAGGIAPLVSAAVANDVNTLTASYRGFPAIGFHFYAWLERSGAAGVGTWYGDQPGVSGVAQAGITGVTVQ